MAALPPTVQRLLIGDSKVYQEGRLPRAINRKQGWHFINDANVTSEPLTSSGSVRSNAITWHVQRDNAGAFAGTPIDSSRYSGWYIDADFIMPGATSDSVDVSIALRSGGTVPTVNDQVFLEGVGHMTVMAVDDLTVTLEVNDDVSMVLLSGQQVKSPVNVCPSISVMNFADVGGYAYAAIEVQPSGAREAAGWNIDQDFVAPALGVPVEVSYALDLEDGAAPVEGTRVFLKDVGTFLLDAPDTDNLKVSLTRVADTEFYAEAGATIAAPITVTKIHSVQSNNLPRLTILTRNDDGVPSYLHFLPPAGQTIYEGKYLLCFSKTSAVPAGVHADLPRIACDTLSAETVAGVTIVPQTTLDAVFVNRVVSSIILTSDDEAAEGQVDFFATQVGFGIVDTSTYNTEMELMFNLVNQYNIFRKMTTTDNAYSLDAEGAILKQFYADAANATERAELLSTLRNSGFISKYHRLQLVHLQQIVQERLLALESSNSNLMSNTRSFLLLLAQRVRIMDQTLDIIASNTEIVVNGDILEYPSATDWWSALPQLKLDVDPATFALEYMDGETVPDEPAA